MGTFGIVRGPLCTEGVWPSVVVTSEVHLKRGAGAAGVGVPAAKTTALARNSKTENCMVGRNLWGKWRIDKWYYNDRSMMLEENRLQKAHGG